MKRPAIKAYLFEAWFKVESKHGSRLESVLAYAEYRRRLTHAFFTDDLWDDYRVVLRDSAAQVDEYSNYGDVMYHVTADSPETLTAALAVCETVTAEWLNRHNINRMKDAP